MIPVIDLFAGPGGLNEGFSSVTDAHSEPVFKTAASFEMESNAIATLRLRAAVRSLRREGRLPQVYYDFLNGRISRAQLDGDSAFAAALAEATDREVFQIELGEATRHESDEVIQARVPADEPWVLIGGPPCQAYSLAGRSRRRGDETFYEDKKHFLFREYLHILDKFRPTVFVMENVKGLLSSRHSGQNMFDLIHSDLSLGGDYEIRSLVVDNKTPQPSDYVIRAENYGVAQRRHRVILLGIRSDSGVRIRPLKPRSHTTVDDVLGDLPKVRSWVSPRRSDSVDCWREARNQGREAAGLRSLHSEPPGLGAAHAPYDSVGARTDAAGLREWLVDPELSCLTLHEPRAHMLSDLVRYEYLAVRMRRDKEHPNVQELPQALRPAHKNLSSEKAPFLDRFKVQAGDAPSSTVASHIAKDGHYYIHPDPEQMRSLTVREAARLQSFPDNYFFCGNRTAQYHQVGNAVPPYLARQIGEQVAAGLRAL